MTHDLKKGFVARNAPYALGQIARRNHASASVNPYMNMSNENLKEAAPGMTWEEAADAFERGWHNDQSTFEDSGLNSPG